MGVANIRNLARTRIRALQRKQDLSCTNCYNIGKMCSHKKDEKIDFITIQLPLDSVYCSSNVVLYSQVCCFFNKSAYFLSKSGDREILIYI